MTITPKWPGHKGLHYEWKGLGFGTAMLLKTVSPYWPLWQVTVRFVVVMFMKLLTNNYVNNMESSRLASCFYRRFPCLRSQTLHNNVCVFSVNRLYFGQVTSFRKTKQHPPSLYWNLVQNVDSELTTIPFNISSAVLSSKGLKPCSRSVQLVLTHKVFKCWWSPWYQRVRSEWKKTSQQVLHINGHMAPKAGLTEIHM